MNQQVATSITPSVGEHAARRHGLRPGPALAVAVLALLVLPVATLVIFSLARGYFYPQLIPGDWSLRAWRVLLRPGSDVWGAMVTTTLVGLTVVVAALAVAVPAGRSLGGN